MKYMAPVAELVALDAVNVILASGEVCERDGLGDDEGGEY